MLASIHSSTGNSHRDLFATVGENFLQRKMNEDETGIHRYEPESKRQNMTRKHLDSPVSKKFKVRPSAGKIMLKAFWDS